MFDEIKREKLYEQRYVQVDIQEDGDYLPFGNTFMDTVLENETIAAYCTGLSPEQKLWVQKAIIKQKKISEIAAECNISVERVKSWRKGAIEKLKRKQRDGSLASLGGDIEC
jgi:DNA-directed RNA polymerase specialized sigma24 family protein